MIVFPRIHGRSDWSKIDFSDEDLIIFAGNFFDSSHHTNEEIVENFENLVRWAEEDPRVVLLSGPHDWQYLDRKKEIPGFREDGYYLFHQSLLKADLRENWIEEDIFCDHQTLRIGSEEIFLEEGFYYIDGEALPLVRPPKISQVTKMELFCYEEFEGQKIGIYSCYGPNIDQSVIDAQAAVFEKFGRKINQVRWDGRHPAFLDHITKTEEPDFFVFFDIDAIPLRKDFLEEMVRRAGKDGILGGEQVSVHISDHVFAASFAFCISRDLYREMGSPSFEITHRSDCAQELTHLAQERGIRVDLLKFSHCLKEHYYWKLPDGRKYGYGSFYEDLVFHNFESRAGSFISLFLNEVKFMLL